MAGAIRGIDPRDNAYTYAHAAGRHFRMRPTERTLPVIYVTKDAEGRRVETSRLVLRAVRKDKDEAFRTGLRALLGANPRKTQGLAKVARVLTMPEGKAAPVQAKPHFSGRKTAAQLGLTTSIPMDWSNVE